MRSLATFAAALFAMISASSCSKYALDRQMEALCKKDGGVKVYETVTLTPSNYDVLWKFKVAAKSTADYYGPDYRYVVDNPILVGAEDGPERGRGMLARSHEAIFRRQDGRLLGERITYWRRGGDLFTFGLMPSSNSCPTTRTSLQQSVFLKGK